MSFYGFCRALSTALLALFHPAKITGLENVPRDGAFMLCANHTNFRDPIVLGQLTKRRIGFMAKKELFNIKLIGSALKKLGAFPVDRSANDLGAIREGMRIVNEGGILGIFPEGHRFTDGEAHALKGGAALIAFRTHCRVLPVYIRSSYKPFAPVYVRVGKPFTYERAAGLQTGEQMRLCTEKIERSLCELKNLT